MLRLQLDDQIRRLRALTGGSTSCGWMYDEIGFFLYSLIKFYKPALVVQTGHLWGKSACIVLEALTDGLLSGTQYLEDSEQRADRRFSDFVAMHTPLSGDRPKVISIDPSPRDVPHAANGIERLRQNYPGQFEFYELPSTDFFRTYGTNLKSQFRSKRILGVVDGDHSAEGCVNDLVNMHALGAGMIFLDDTRWLPHIGSFGRAFGRKYGYQFLELPQYNGVAVLHKREPQALGAPRFAPSVWRLTGLGGLRLFCHIHDLVTRLRVCTHPKKPMSLEGESEGDSALGGYVD